LFTLEYDLKKQVSNNECELKKEECSLKREGLTFIMSLPLSVEDKMKYLKMDNLVCDK